LKPAPAQHAFELLHICHSCFLLRSQSGTTLLLDPYFGADFKWKGHLEKHAGPAPAVRPEEIAECHGIVVTHDHPDHCESKAIGAIMGRTRCQLWGPAGIYRRAVEAGIDNMQVNKLEPGNHFKIGDIEITALANKGSEDMKPCMRMSYLFRCGDTTVFHGGDSHGPSPSWLGITDAATLVLLWPTHVEKTVQFIKPHSLALTHCDKFQPGEFLCGYDEDQLRAELTRRFKALVVLAPARGEWFWPEKLSVDELRRRTGKSGPRPRPAEAAGAAPSAPGTPGAPATPAAPAVPGAVPTAPSAAPPTPAAPGPQAAPVAPAAPAAPAAPIAQAGPTGVTSPTSQTGQTSPTPTPAAPPPSPLPAPAAAGADRWRAAREASVAWWCGENRRRPLLRVTAPLDPTDPPGEWDQWSLVRTPDHMGESIRRYAGICAKTFHAAEAMPYFNVNFAPGVLASFLSGFLELGQDTAWVEKAHDWEAIERMELRLDAGNVWWTRAKRATDLALEIGGGEMVPSVTDLGGVLDTLAALRGTNDLLTDLVDCPERVKAASARLVEAWHRCFDELAAPIVAKFGGTVERWGYFSPGKHYPIQCDFAAMISPDMFAEFVLPTLEAQAERLDYVIYHLDGPGQLPHLDHLLGMKKLHAVQWVPGAGNAPSSDPQWYPMYKKIQATGRAVVMGLPDERMERILGELDPKLIISSKHCASRAAAEEALARVEKLSARG